MTEADLKPDLTVRPDDARPLGKPDECFYCGQPIGGEHAPSCAITGSRVYEAAEFGVGYPISTYPEGHHVLFWFPTGERGAGGFETATSFPSNHDGRVLEGWTHGGPNSGDDFCFHEEPTLWYRLPKAPTDV